MGKLNLSTPTKTGIAVYAVLFIVFCLYAACGLVDFEGFWLPIVVTLAFAAMIFVMTKREAIQARIEQHRNWAKPAVCVVLVLASFFLLERSYNISILSITPYLAFVNLCLVGALFCIVFFAGQQSKAAAIAFLFACFALGLANYFVIAFKGQPVLPADLFALETAAAVGGGYTYAVDTNVVIAYIVFAASSLLASFLPPATIKMKQVLANAGMSLLLVVGFGLWFTNYDIEAAYGCEVDVWGARESYAQNGSLLCFLKRAQDLTPTAPTDYSPEAVESILAAYEVHSTGALLDPDTRPSVIVVMNETFADLSAYSALEGVYDGPSFYNSVDDAIVKGNAYVSALGGGTCNSEFEFLTGSSMGSLGGGVYPYVLYDLDGTENLAAYFNALGYDTSAVHPADAANWRRSSVYDQLGFNRFIDIGSFEGADLLRELPTDKETYTKILDVLATEDAPQFIFDVTIQNHGGYETGEIPATMQVDAPIDGVSYPELNEYLSCIEQSDQDLQYLIEGLRELDRPVILCFFGDHQPGFADWISSLSYGKDVEDFDLKEVQARYTVPYMIWKNYEDSGTSASEVLHAGTADAAFRNQQEKTEPEAGSAQNASALRPAASQEASALHGSDATSEAASEASDPAFYTESSLNYLGSMLVRAAGLPLTDYQQFLLATQKDMPAINLNGYMDHAGVWHWIGEESTASDAYQAYALTQFDNLFNKSGETYFQRFVASFEYLQLLNGDFVETPA